MLTVFAPILLHLRAAEHIVPIKPLHTEQSDTLYSPKFPKIPRNKSAAFFPAAGASEESILSRKITDNVITDSKQHLHAHRLILREGCATYLRSICELRPGHPHPRNE